MSKPHRCPLCNGSGKLNNSDYNTSTSSFNIGKKTCNGCNGSGIVWEPENNNPYVPIQPFPFEPFKPYNPYEPIVPVETWPKDYVFPEEIKEKSKEDVIKLLTDMIAKLMEEKE